MAILRTSGAILKAPSRICPKKKTVSLSVFACIAPALNRLCCVKWLIINDI